MRPAISPKEDTTKLVLQGFFISYDKYNRAKIMFLDDYDHAGNNKTLSFTKGYLIQKAKPDNGKSPLTDCNSCFNVKYGNNKVGYIDDKPVPLLELKQHKVEIQVEINKYNFSLRGNVIRGWNIKMLKMSLLEM